MSTGLATKSRLKAMALIALAGIETERLKHEDYIVAKYHGRYMDSIKSVFGVLNYPLFHWIDVKIKGLEPLSFAEFKKATINDSGFIKDGFRCGGPMAWALFDYKRDEYRTLDIARMNQLVALTDLSEDSIRLDSADAKILQEFNPSA